MEVFEERLRGRLLLSVCVGRVERAQNRRCFFRVGRELADQRAYHGFVLLLPCLIEVEIEVHHS